MRLIDEIAERRQHIHWMRDGLGALTFLDADAKLLEYALRDLATPDAIERRLRKLDAERQSVGDKALSQFFVDRE